MIEAGQSFLKHMGWQEHQVLFVAHNDTKHPHVHLIINRVHPETGMTIDDTWSKTRAQKWALAYEREHGRIYCQAREAKYSRDAGRDAGHMTYREWQMWQEIAKDSAFDPEFRKAMEAGEWDVLKGTQHDDRSAFWKETGHMRKDLRAALRDDVRAEFAPRWKDYALEKEKRDEKARLYDREARRALREYRRHGPLHGVEAVAQIKQRQKDYHARHREELWQMRSAIASGQKERLEELTGPALERLSADRAKTYAEVLKGQRGEKDELRKDQASGERRRDLLSAYDNANPASPTRLTPEQTAAYIAHARSATGRDAEIDHARREVTHADRARSQEAGQDPRNDKPAKEATEHSREKKDKDHAQEAKRRSGLDWYLAKRAHDRDRERGGGGRDR